MNQQMTEKAMSYLREAYTKSQQDESYKEDQIRFKVQEMHFLNQFYKEFSHIEYKSGDKGTWLDFSRSIRNNILVELNINALSEIYELNSATFKEVIGSLNWKKFAERIKT